MCLHVEFFSAFFAVFVIPFSMPRSIACSIVSVSFFVVVFFFAIFILFVFLMFFYLCPVEPYFFPVLSVLLSSFTSSMPSFITGTITICAIFIPCSICTSSTP